VVDFAGGAALSSLAMFRDAPQRPVVEDHLGSVLLGLLLLITLINVAVRYFTAQSFAWTEEISCFLMLMLALASSAGAIVRHAHIRVEYFSEKGSAQRQHRLALLAALSNTLFFALLGVLSSQLAWDEFRYEETSPAIGIPKWWYSVWLPVFCAILCARSVERVKLLWRRGQPQT